jgi:hypothetical protein
MKIGFNMKLKVKISISLINQKSKFAHSMLHDANRNEK